jgi:hypothetical protein
MSPAFFPNRNDQGEMSVDDGALISAASAHEHYTKTIGLQSAGTWVVTCGEAVAIGLEPRANPLPARPNPRADAQPATLPEWNSHAVVDFRGVRTADWKSKAGILADLAQGRGPAFLPGFDL